MAPKFHEIKFFALWKNRQYKTSFTEVITDEGLCFSFNILQHRDIFHENIDFHNFDNQSDIQNITNDWNLDDGYKIIDNLSLHNSYPKRVCNVGRSSGLEITFHLNTSDLDYVCQGFDQGFKIMLHTPGDYPQISTHDIIIPLNTDVTIALRPNMIVTSNGLKFYKSEKRQCFYNYERKLKFFKIYSQSNCEYECLTNFTLPACGCVKFSMPKDKNVSICGMSKIKCYTDALYEYYEDEIKHEFNKKLCNCLPGCTSIVYETEVLQKSYEWRNIAEANKFIPRFGVEKYVLACT